MKLPPYEVVPSGKMFKLITGRLTFFAATRQATIQRLIVWLITSTPTGDSNESKNQSST